MRPSICLVTKGLLLSFVLLSAPSSRADGPHAAAQTPARSVYTRTAAAPTMTPEEPVQASNVIAAGGQHYRQRPAAQLGDVSSVRFADGEEVSLPGSVRVLRSVQQMLAAHPEVRKLRIEGHADDVGDPCFNLMLSKRRVRGVVRWLTANGVAVERLELLACGRRYATEGSRSARARAENRRVELVVSEPSQTGALRDRCDPVELK